MHVPDSQQVDVSLDSGLDLGLRRWVAHGQPLALPLASDQVCDGIAALRRLPPEGVDVLQVARSLLGGPDFAAALFDQFVPLGRTIVEGAEPSVPRRFAGAVVAVEKTVVKLVKEVTNFDVHTAP